jgi:uncharacterized protein (DUF1697 family)
MADVADVFAGAGCADVRTYIQSGNVVFSATVACAKELAQSVAAQIADRFGLSVPVVLRTADELQKVSAANPFLKAGADQESLHVVFLANAPDKRHVAALDPQRSPGDRFEVRGKEIYLQLPNGMGRTKLSNAYFDSKLDTISTVRNWRTVLKLVEMAGPA